MTLPTGTCGDSLQSGTPGPDGRDTSFPSTCGSGLGGALPRAVGGTGRPLGKTFFLHCQRRHRELLKIPTYLPTSPPKLYPWCLGLYAQRELVRVALLHADDSGPRFYHHASVGIVQTP